MSAVPFILDLVDAENLEVCDFHRGWVLLGAQFLVYEPRSITETRNWLREELKATFQRSSYEASNTLHDADASTIDTTLSDAVIWFPEHATYSESNILHY